MKAFRRVAIIGTGLIGGSIGLALKKNKVTRVGFDRPAVLKEASRFRAIDERSPNLAEAVKSADLVILAVPIGEILRLLPELVGSVSSSAIITDTGSTKKQICELAKELGLKNFIGGHPLAGREKSGIANADDKLFSARNWIFCPGGNQLAMKRLKEFVRLLGAKPVVVEPETHDKILAVTSHLPQLVSTLLASSVSELFTGGKSAVKTFAGPGLLDMTRLASSPFSVWGDVLASNRAEVSRALGHFVWKTSALADHFSDLERLQQEFEIANRMRRGLE